MSDHVFSQGLSYRCRQGSRHKISSAIAPL
jgi:hypothetical protein